MFNIIDQLNQANSQHRAPCIQPRASTDMITLSQWKTRNFLASTSSRLYKMPDTTNSRPPKPQSKRVTPIKYKFELEDEICHKILKQVLQSSRNPLLPMHRQHEPNTQHLWIGQSNASIINQSQEEPSIGSKTNRFNRSLLKRNSSQPFLDDTKLNNLHKSANSSKEIKLTERSRSKIYLGSTIQASQTQTKLFELDFDSKIIRDSSVKRRLSQKQFNLYKNRKIATSSIASKVKQHKEEEIEERKKQEQSQL